MHEIKYPHNQKAVILPVLRIIEGENGEMYAECILDVYAIIRAFQLFEPSLQHGLKKVLRPGQDKNSGAEDLKEAADSIMYGARYAALMEKIGCKAILSLNDSASKVTSGNEQDVNHDDVRKLPEGDNGIHEGTAGIAPVRRLF